MTATSDVPLSSARFRGKPITVYFVGDGVTRPAVLEATITESGGEATDLPWHKWEVRGAYLLSGFVRASTEGTLWLWGWGPDRQAALLLACSAR